VTTGMSQIISIDISKQLVSKTKTMKLYRKNSGSFSSLDMDAISK